MSKAAAAARAAINAAATVHFPARAPGLSPMDLGEIGGRLEVQDLYSAYADCLDSDALERWPDFFTADCYYRITSAENYEAGMPLGLI